MIFIAAFNLLALASLQGCAGKHEPKSYVSVEKAPMKVVYIDYSRDIKATDVDRYIRAVSNVPYQDIKLNENSVVDVRYNVSAASDHSSATALNLNKGE